MSDLLSAREGAGVLRFPHEQLVDLLLIDVVDFILSLIFELLSVQVVELLLLLVVSHVADLLQVAV